MRVAQICRIKGKGEKAKVVVLKPGACKLKAKNGKKTIRAKERVK